MLVIAAAIGPPSASATFRQQAGPGSERSIGPDSLAALEPSSSANALIDSLDAKLSMYPVTQLLSDYIFVAREESADDQSLQSVPNEDRFAEFERRHIRRVEVLELPVFGARASATGIEEPGRLGRLGNAIHVQTHERVIRDYLLFESGQRLDPYELADTERILRGSGFIQDAVIYAMPVPEAPDSVDLFVITRDLWSLGVTPKIKTRDRYEIRFFDRNLLGLGHDLEHRVDVDRTRRPSVDYRGGYTARNLYGSFVDGRLGLQRARAEDNLRLSFSRSPVSPEIDLLGALSFSGRHLKSSEEDPRPPVKIVGQELWLGRAFSLGRNAYGGAGRTRLTAAISVNHREHPQRPPLSEDENRAYRDRTLFLGSLAINRSEFRRGRFIYGTGRTEDIPEGFLLGLNAGYELSELEDRPYLGIIGRGARYFNGIGYAALDGGWGGYLRGGRLEDGMLSLKSSVFSELVTLGRFTCRQHASVSYVLGIRRREGDYLTLDEEAGLRVLSRSRLRGQQRLALNLETVCFTPWQPLGFRVTGFAFVSGGLIGADNGSFSSASFYPSLGVGLRLKNERLIFDAVELRLALFPRDPPGTDPDLVKLSSPDALSFVVLSFQPPATLPFR